MYATTPKGNMGYDQYTVPNYCSCRTYFCCFSLALENICSWPLVPFFQISSENRADKTTHNTFRDCRVHFFRQPFSKQLYMKYLPVEGFFEPAVQSVIDIATESNRVKNGGHKGRLKHKLLLFSCCRIIFPKLWLSQWHM